MNGITFHYFRTDFPATFVTGLEATRPTTEKASNLTWTGFIQQPQSNAECKYTAVLKIRHQSRSWFKKAAKSLKLAHIILAAKF